MGFDSCRAAVRDTIAIAVKGQLFSPSKEPPIEHKEERLPTCSKKNRSAKLHEFVAEWMDEA
jgi:hypothetical protein